MKLLRWLFLLLLGLFSFAFTGNAQHHNHDHGNGHSAAPTPILHTTTSPTAFLTAEYQEKHQAILKKLEKSTDLGFAQKHVLYYEEIDALKEAFQREGQAAYAAKSIQMSVKSTCKGGSKSTACETACLQAPAPELYTQADWIKVDGAPKAASIQVTDSSACLQLPPGKTNYTATLNATFKYRPESIAALLEKDAKELFDSLIKSAPEYLR